MLGNGDRRKSMRFESLSRRGVLRIGGGAALLSLAACAGAIPGGRDPFTLGVASGYPGPDSIVLWTRLVPEPFAPDGSGGMVGGAHEVGWEVAHDRRFARIAARGTSRAEARWGYSVHAEVRGLEPARAYWYRFIVDGVTSPVGRTRTAPAPDAEVARLRFAYASCQQYEQGWFTAHRHMAAEDLDLVAFLGDYIYESSWGGEHVRKHEAGEPTTLAQYRNRHACYRLDRDLQASHAAFPWIVTWDDHEVDNDYANDRSEELAPRGAFLARRAAGYQAFYEHMPLPASMRPNGPAMRLHARLDWGALARFNMLDNRQYRDWQACPRPTRGGGNVIGASCTERLDPGRSLLGRPQEAWLDDGFVTSRARWNVLAQQTLFSPLRRVNAAGEARYSSDGWDGYPAARARLVESMIAHRLANPIVIGGDVHAFYVADVKQDFDAPRSPTVASEICGTSITSQGPASARLEVLGAANPHLKLADGRVRGYVAMTLAPSRAEADLRVVETVKQPGAAIRTLARVAIAAGRPGVDVTGVA
jgi:alkaline phosphatase D